MKKASSVCGFFLCAGLGTVAFAQDQAAPRPTPQRQVVPSPTSTTSTMTIPMPMPIPHPVDVDIREQSDCPIHVTVNEALKGTAATHLKVKNNSGSVVTAFVLRVDFEPYGLNHMMILGSNGLSVGDELHIPLPLPNLREGMPKPVVSVDYLQFADGTSWGENNLGRSKDVTAFLKGRNEALTRLEEMLAGQDATDVHKAFDTWTSSSFGEPNSMPAGRAPRYVDYYARGYEEVINILRRMPRNSQLGIDLANRLEARTREQ